MLVFLVFRCFCDGILISKRLRSAGPVIHQDADVLSVRAEVSARRAFSRALKRTALVAKPLWCFARWIHGDGPSERHGEAAPGGGRCGKLGRDPGV